MFKPLGLILSLLFIAAPANTLPRDRGEKRKPSQKHADQSQATKEPSIFSVQINGNGKPQKQAAQDDSHNWHDWIKAFGPASWSNWALFGGAVWAGLMALRTLKAIETQTRATQDAALVAKQNMVSMIEKERARVRVEKPLKTLDFLRPGYVRKEKPESARFRGEPHTIELSVFNRGYTAARDAKMCFTFSIIRPGGQHPIRETEVVEPRDLFENSLEPFRHKVSLFGGIPQDDLEAIHKAESILQISGRITYTDAFEAAKERVTAFSFMWKPDIQWHEQRGVRAVSEDCSDWYEWPAEENYTT